MLEQLKHFNAQVAMVPQSSMALSQGLAAGGQQSCIGSAADISVASCDFSLKAAAPTAGRTATDIAIRKANMVRTTAIGAEYPASAGQGSSDDFASLVVTSDCNT